MSDQPQAFSPDDPRLTAYLLGEMDAEEQKAFEASATILKETLKAAQS